MYGQLHCGDEPGNLPGVPPAREEEGKKGKRQEPPAPESFRAVLPVYVHMERQFYVQRPTGPTCTLELILNRRLLNTEVKIDGLTSKMEKVKLIAGGQFASCFAFSAETEPNLLYQQRDGRNALLE